MQSNNHQHPCSAPGRAVLPEGEKQESTLRRTARVALPALAMVLVAGSAYMAHAWTNEAHQAEVKLRQAAYFQSTAAMKTNQQPTLRFTFADGPVSEKTDATSLLLAVNTPSVKQRAAGLYVDDKFVGAVQDADKLKEMLNNLLVSAQNGDSSVQAAFLNKIQIITKDYETASIVSDDAMMVLLSGDYGPVKTYTVVNGDTVGSIASKNSISQQKLAQANPGLSLQSLHPGDEIRLEPARKILSVQTVQMVPEVTNIPYQKKVVKSNQLYLGTKFVKTKGTNGQKTATYEVTRVNGQETSCTKLTEGQNKAPVTEVTEVGTKAQSGTATGCFLWPTPTLTDITSGYGARWGTFHYGLDLSGPDAMGQPIYAADGGTVIFSAFDDSGYGNHVVIDHGNGFISIYGHASKLMVKSGQKVAQGQLIALVGSTGFSTGAHCHFEVRKDGNRIDPTNLICPDTSKLVAYTGAKVTAEQIEAMNDAADVARQTSMTAYQKLQAH